MSSNQRLILILVLIAVVIGGLLAYNFEYRPVPDVEWDRTYAKESKDPYGSWLFHQVLTDTYTEADMQYTLPDSSTTATDELYIRIAQRGSLADTQVDSLLAFVAEGNTAVIIAGELGGKLDSLIPDIYTYYESYYRYPALNFYDSLKHRAEGYPIVAYDIELEPKDKQLQPVLTFYPDYNEAGDGSVANFGEIYMSSTQKPQEEEEEEVSEYANEVVDYYADVDNQICLALPYGVNGGTVYLLTVPSAFSNIGLQQPAMMAFADQFLSMLDCPAAIYYDDTPGTYIPFHSDHSSSPIQYILSDRSLRLGYYLTLAAGLLYLLFRSRRTQKAIPLVEKKNNTSLEYIDTLTKLFIASDQHEKLVKRLEKIFYHRVQRQYFVSMDHPDFTSVLAKKARVEEGYIQNLLQRFEEVKNGGKISVYQLEKITQRIERILQN